MKHILIVCALLVSAAAFSQDAIQPVAKNNGYYGRITGGVLAGEYSTMSFQFANGYRFNRFDVGMGIGFERSYNNNYAPLFLESRYHFTNGSTRPFVGITAGYLASLNQFYRNMNGYTAGASVGISHFFTPHFGVSSQVGYRYTLTNEPQYVYYIWGGEQATLERQMQRIEIRVGIIFR